MFRGVASVTMDSRGRMALATRFRDEAVQRSGNLLVATIDPNETCLLLYSVGDWEEVQRRLEALSNIGTSARLLQRLLIGHATDVEMDSQGRVLIPAMLREYGALEKDVPATRYQVVQAGWCEYTVPNGPEIQPGALDRHA